MGLSKMFCTGKTSLLRGFGMNYSPLSEMENEYFNTLNETNIQFLRRRYNRVNRWVVADLVGRSAYRYPDKMALIYRDMTLTYQELEEECNRGCQCFD